MVTFDSASPAVISQVRARTRRYTQVASILLLLFAVVLPFIPPFNGQDYQRWLVGAAFMAAMAVAFDFTAGYINIVNFGFAAFVGVGAYMSGLIAANLGIPRRSAWSSAASRRASSACSPACSVLRLRGIYAAVMTWFVGLALMGLARNLTDITRGSLGLNVPLLLDTLGQPAVLLRRSLGLLLITILVLTAVIRSKYGLAFRAIGQNLQAAKASGINPTRFLVINFTLSCFFAGILGGFYAHYYGILTPDIMLTSHTVEVLAVAYIGGRGSLWGPAIIAFPLTIAVELMRTNLSNLPGLHLVIYGVLLVVVMIFWPGGVAGVIRKAGARMQERWLTKASTAESAGAAKPA